jgi:hypothetical protein
MRIKLFLLFAILIFTSLSGFVTTQLLPRADESVRVVNAATDAVMFVMALSAVIPLRRTGVVRWLLFFLAAATVTVIFNLDQLSLPAQANGLRQPLFMLSALVLMHDLLTSDRSEQVVRWMDRFLIAFAIVQFPLSLYQFVKYGAGDAVGGTYGLSGGSGNITLLLFVIVFYLLVRFGSVDDGDSFAVSRILPFSLLLAPVALNETKIAFVFLAMFLAFLVLSRRKAYKSIPILALGALLLFMLNEMYTEAVKDPSTFMMNQEFLERYLVYDPRPGMDVPRFQKLMLMFDGMGKHLGAMALGYGYGLFVGENILGKSMYVKSFWYTAGTRPSLFSIWMQGGLLAVIGMAGAVFSFLFRSLSAAVPTVKRFRWFLVVMMAIALVYNESWLNRPFSLIFAYLSTWLVLQGSEGQAAVAAGDEDAAGDEADGTAIPADDADDAEGALAGAPRLS